MQVSAVCADSFNSFDIQEQKNRNDSNSTTTETSPNTFMSSLKKYNSEADIKNIGEWKDFCEKQIMANNLDYIA